MNSLQDKLFSILDELKQYKTKDKNELLNQYVIKRLDRSFDNYQKDLMLRFNSILSYDDLKILKNWKKIK